MLAPCPRLFCGHRLVLCGIKKHILSMLWPQFIFLPPPLSCFGLFFFPFYFSAWGWRPSHSVTRHTLQFARARHGSATNDSDRDNWDWLQTHFVLSVVHRALCIFYRCATSWRECRSVAIHHVGVDKYPNGPLLFFLFSVLSSLSRICVLLPTYNSFSLCVSLTAPQPKLPSISHPKLSELKHFILKLYWLGIRAGSSLPEGRGRLL